MKVLLAPLAATLLAALCHASTAAADTLHDIYAMALENDPQLRAAEATYRANIELEKQALAAMLPQLSGEASYREQDIKTTREGVITSPTGDLGLARQTTRLDTHSTIWSVGLSQRLFDLPTWFTFRSGKETTRQAEAQLAHDQQTVIVRVAETYLNVLRALDNLHASEAEERATKRQLEQTQQRYDVGLVAITDVHEAQAAYDAVVVQRLTDEGGLATAYEALSRLTGRSHHNLWLLNKDFPVTNPEPMDRAQWVDFALANNLALKAATYGTEASRQLATARRMEHAPKITGSFVYSEEELRGKQRAKPASRFITDPDSDIDSEVFLVTLSMPLFTGGGISSQRRQAHEQYNATLQRSIDTQRSIIEGTRALHIAVTTDVQRIKAREQGIISAQSALDATQAGYEVGTRNVVDVLQAQRVLFTAMRDYANARYDYITNLFKLKQAAGTLSPEDLIGLNQWLVEPDSPTANTYQDYQS